MENFHGNKSPLLATITCATGCTLTPLSTCVNSQIDFNNCGTVAGVCSTRSAFSLAGAIPVYAITGTAPNQITTFEFYESHFSSSIQYYNFQIILNEN
ncbi:hypothetical protein I4U23_027493 [Adineta vaga]|nr:hypothetical protein I4U23_027493 [Adineta vaga]